MPNAMRFKLLDLVENRVERRAQISKWMAAAAAGDVDAQLALGWEYARGDVLAPDMTTAHNRFDRAAGSGRRQKR